MRDLRSQSPLARLGWEMSDTALHSASGRPRAEGPGGRAWRGKGRAAHGTSAGEGSPGKRRSTARV